jgi:hypothetical protein
MWGEEPDDHRDANDDEMMTPMITPSPQLAAPRWDVVTPVLPWTAARRGRRARVPRPQGNRDIHSSVLAPRIPLARRAPPGALNCGSPPAGRPARRRRSGASSEDQTTVGAFGPFDVTYIKLPADHAAYPEERGTRAPLARVIHWLRPGERTCKGTDRFDDGRIAGGAADARSLSHRECDDWCRPEQRRTPRASQIPHGYPARSRCPD